MRRFLTIAFVCICCGAAAQNYDVVNDVKADFRKLGGMEGPHRFEVAEPTPSPKGYKPFYISHYGRHGQRYCSSDETYTVLRDVLSEAHAEGALTERGEEFWKKYEAFYKIPLINTGDLVPLGFEQHKKIAAWVYDRFPKVFKKNKKVDCRVSTAVRSVVSMSSFCLSLKEKNPKLQITQTSNHTGLTVVTPTSAPRELRRSFELDDISMIEPVADFKKRTIDYDGILSTFFNDPAYPEKSYGKMRFVDELFMLLAGYKYYEDEPLFDGYLTEDQLATLWEGSNYYSYHCDLTARYGNIPLLEDFISRAEDAFNDPTKAADLRFGHDYVYEAFMCLINANGCGTVPEKTEDVKYWFQNYNVPMAATVLFVFYRNRKGDILFKILQNEEEVTLPQLSAVSGPYYRWADFTEWAKTVMAAHPEIRK